MNEKTDQNAGYSCPPNRYRSFVSFQILLEYQMILVIKVCAGQPVNYIQKDQWYM